MRISDWSSDVCSSDLLQCRHGSTFPAVHVFCPKVGCAARSCWPAPSLRRSRSRRILARHISETMSHSPGKGNIRSEEHTSELQSLMRISYAVFCLKKKKKKTQ